MFGALDPHHNILATQASPPRIKMASVSGLEGDMKSVEMSSDMVYLCADSHSSENFEDPHSQALCSYSIESAKPNEDTSKPLKSWKDLVPKG